MPANRAIAGILPCLAALLGGCAAPGEPGSLPGKGSPPGAGEAIPAAWREREVSVGFLLLDGVYNSELMAPFDVFQHTVFHARPGMRVFTVGRAKSPVRTFEGLRIVPDFDLEGAPAIDVLVVPSAEHSMDTDLEDRRLVDWIRERGREAGRVLSLCDGAFLLAEAGLLEGRECTTFPEDVGPFQVRYPRLAVRRGVSFVADGRAVTGAGGAKSYDPAMFLVEEIYGKAVAEGIGRGLVLDWALERVEHVVVSRRSPSDGRPGCWLPGETIPADVAFEDAGGNPATLAEIAAGARAVVLYFMGGATAEADGPRAGFWCEDTFDDLPLLRHLALDYEPKGVRFVGVLCPPVYHEAQFGYEEGAFLRHPSEDPVFGRNRRRFVEASLELHRRGLVPFERVLFDPRFRALSNPSRGEASPEAGPRPPWQGRFKWSEDTQAYGTPTMWVLTPALEVFGDPFFMNVYESEGRALRYTVRDVRSRLDRLLR